MEKVTIIYDVTNIRSLIGSHIQVKLDKTYLRSVYTQLMEECIHYWIIRSLRETNYLYDGYNLVLLSRYEKEAILTPPDANVRTAIESMVYNHIKVPLNIGIEIKSELHGSVFIIHARTN